MKKLLAAALAAVVLSTSAAFADARVQVGRLSCDVDGGIGYLIGSSKDMTCKFIRKGHKTEVYYGNIKKLGLDIGVTDRTRIEWLVFSASSTKVGKGSLRGTYVGGAAEASLGAGLGANWLIGGSRRGFALQPWSVQASTGVNLTWAFAGLTLD
jgi:opacity protein-like surface antigen